ncbi:uncharacterized protein LOC111333174 isoform X2 [Stylophora pistillata]|nr:uncharacterized protein LOC111333174 isoform X2 [Stylophora pistillata]XP_022794437.1 uncharacterized protein LOC111333174 isoform X2 [Stylophora pistillata]
MSNADLLKELIMKLGIPSELAMFSKFWEGSGQGMKNDDGSYTFAPETIQVTEKQHNLTVKSDMLFLNETVFMERVQVYAYTQHSGETSRGRLISLRLNSAGVSEARVNLKRVEELNLMDADLTLTSQVKVMSISEVQVHTHFNLHLPKMALGESSVIIHALVVVLTTHDKNNTGYNHDQHFTVNYTKVEVQIPTPTVVTHTAGSSVNESSGSAFEPTSQLEDNATTGMGSSSSLAVKVAVPIAIVIAALIACMVWYKYGRRHRCGICWKSHQYDDGLV